MIKDMVQLAGTSDPDQVAAIGGKVVDGYTFVPLDYIQQFANNPDFVVLVSEIARPGVQLFATKLEYILFPPGTESNKLFNFGAYKWDDCFGMPFVLIIFPSAALAAAEEIALSCDIHFVDGTPVLIGDAIKTFPINGPSVLKLENLPDSKVYAGALNPEGGFQGYQERMAKLLQEERDKTKQFLESIGAPKEATDALEEKAPS